MGKTQVSDLDWQNLGFEYHDLPYRFRAVYRNGAWEPGELTTDSDFHLSEAAAALHYGQQVFEGLKAYRRPDGGVNLFRPDQNAARMARSADRLRMPAYPTDLFVEAVKQVVAANQEFVPPYGSGATLYIRPLLIGSGPVVGVHPADEYIFNIYVTPVGAYYKGGLTPTAYVTSEYDRAAHGGTGQAKVGGNYAASMLPGEQAHAAGYSDVVYLDPRLHENIEELGSANFFGITKDGRFLTPKSPSILPSITKYSLLALAAEAGLQPEETTISIYDLDQFEEAGAMGTAAVISPVGSITHNGDKHVFYSETEVGPKTQALYSRLVGIQFGTESGPADWAVDVPLE
ncbi:MULTISPECIES: branched-chain amino acid aminotransferase [Weissella]|uniref:branched-chain amino acid aminotransferase n=1 Tax=Weissella TaxID=46255 RepID=UPI0008FDC8ED|nr:MULTISPECIES: branched-chain amino acid aminotransferase [Weissella]MBJ7641158.1 branched-chain amino acid aminotransferase [Weissella confusa]MBJ7643263.1 branched-chain amino acid aminotransferase [Weissella confusa]MBJ7655456.1 branched-chain amino acid aminotransferase [Weissella confusa]MCT0021951.1 branched-chain amino acid aminotransferase [Weissella cibaria]OJF03121.1 branched chain amino acid aminotransferase [Weissella confusa]